MRYDFFCAKCKKVIEIEKRMSESNPIACPICKSNKFTRHFGSAPAVIYANRPIWTYNDCKKYKTFRQNGGPLQKVDPGKHGDLGAWNTDAERAPEKKKKKRVK